MRSDDDDGTDTLRRAHRIASERLGDAPDARVRTAVLAAAARGVDARPRAVASDPSPMVLARGSHRWTWSAAALLAVSVMTGLVATHLMRDAPEQITTVASSQPVPRPAESPAPATEPSMPLVARADDVRRVEPRPRGQPRAAERMASRSSETGKVVVTSKPEPDSPVAPENEAVLPPAFVPPPPAAAPTASPKTEAADKAMTMAPAFAPSRMAQGTPSTETSRYRVGRAAEPLTPEAWVDRIFKLRASGNDFEADREVEALRARHPAFAIPPAVLGGTGTR